MSTCEKGHPDAFVARSGAILCESCARIANGWIECKAYRCQVLSPTDIKFCAYHEGQYEIVECADCDGQGDIECEELNCHGAFCTEGVQECPNMCDDGRVAVLMQRVSV